MSWCCALVSCCELLCVHYNDNETDDDDIDDDDDDDDDDDNDLVPCSPRWLILL